MFTVRRRSTFAALAAAIRACGACFLFFVVTAPALAGTVTLAWDPPTGPAPAGYFVYYGPAAGNYPTKIDVGNVTTYTVPNLVAGSTYHFAATDYDASSNESGFSNDISATVPGGAPVAQFTGSPVSGTFPLTVNFTNSSTGSITSYAWTFGDGATSTVASPSHVYSAAGNYTVSLTVTGAGGSNSLTRTSYVTVTAPGAAPVAQFTGSPVSGTFPLTVNFTNSSTGTITSYAWTFGDGATSTSASPSHVYSAAGVYTVSLTVAGAGGSNTQTRSSYVTVTAPPPTSVVRVGAVVDAHSASGTSSNLNGVLEPGETVRIEPTWQNETGSTVTLTGTASGYSGPSGATYSLGDSGAKYGTVGSGAVANCQTAMTDCYRMSVSNPATRPSLHWDAVFTETLSNGVAVTSTLHVGRSFSDVPETDVMYTYIETILHNNVTLGYAGGTFQPVASTIRAATMMFVARGAVAPAGDGAIPVSGLVGSTAYNCAAGGTSVIVDMLPTDVGCKQAHYLLGKGVNVTFQCSAAHACPSANTSRAAMSVLISGAIATGGDAGVPAFGTFNDSGAPRSYDCRVAGLSHFPDVLYTDAFCRHVNYLWARNIVGGYADGTFKPADNVLRSQMAKFISAGFALSLY